jgi:hypothetical protein
MKDLRRRLLGVNLGFERNLVFSVKIGGEVCGLCDVKFWCLSVGA